MTFAEAYLILGLSRTATVAEIRQAYRRLVNQTHPDKGGDATGRGLLCRAGHREPGE